ncbi:hypothetical protein F5X98DRAFT_390554 [Xylaria grammica]|nr:hypothetical protein F5X98DRAFT_390554 [Xylaria grammica]
MSNTTSTEPFKMRIPSPDPDLTGQVVAQAVPDDPNRTGSIYADQFLARKCPSHFDELQRRQFFCILDLRRLKYAADEIFAQKDWKLNILNFAKEYEKSRGLIMLRYGLYEFKNVKPSSEVLKKWRAAHGLPPEPEDDQASSPNRQKAGTTASTKRKAEEELTPRDNTLMVSNANQNKRRNLAHEVDDPTLTVPAPFKKSKRKADETEEVDENKPNKQLKPTPSAATSLLANIINKPSNGGTSPLKPSSQTSLFGISKPNTAQDSNFATKANPFQPTSSSLFPSPAKTNNVGTPSGSVFAGSNVVATPTASAGNIFGYLSESSPSSSGNEKDDADDHETDSEPEPDSEEQGPSAAVSTGTSTPPVQNGASLFGASKANNTSSIFGEPLKPTGQTAKGGLFGRVQLGANGQPVRANAGPDEKQEGSQKRPWAADKQETKTPAKRPATPSSSFAFSFGQQPSSTPAVTPSSQASGIFGGSAKPNGASAFSFTQALPDSPFPAPSSIGTTPVNGTPEPQAPHEDGEEVAQQQISLTEGGPGEEDETILHEVRAKAIKYIPVQPGDDDEGKSPWSTRGVGPLRVLKNRSTGAVRVLLRAEPRGHIALNKTILPDMEYKSRSKTVNFVTANDDGSGLETWMLQVKKPEFASTLAEVLEANKIANKK